MGHNLTANEAPLRRTIAIVVALNLGYFGIEFAVATHIGSVSLFADSLDFIERDRVASTIVELRRPWAFVGCHRLSILQRAAGFQVSRDAGRAKRMTTDPDLHERQRVPVVRHSALVHRQLLLEHVQRRKGLEQPLGIQHLGMDHDFTAAFLQLRQGSYRLLGTV